MKLTRIVVALIVMLLPVVAGAATWIVVPHMGGTLAINPDRIGTVWYSTTGEPASATLRIIYDGDAQGKALAGSEASAAWQAIQADQALLSQFLWVPHMNGTLGIPHRSVKALFFAPPEPSKPAKLRIIHDVDTKIIEGAEAESLWKQLSAK